MFSGLGVSPGIAIGRIHLIDHYRVRAERKAIPKDLLAAEEARFRDALNQAKTQLEKAKEKIVRDFKDKTHLLIIDAHISMLEDQTLIEAVTDIIQTDQINVEWALEQVLEQFSAAFDQMDNFYLRERKADIEQVGEEIKRALVGATAGSLSEIKEDTIVIAHDLTPADTVHMHKGKVKGFATDLGGRTSHTAIMARSLEIPAVVALGDISRKVKSGEPAIVDGINGLVIVNPTKEQFIQYAEKRNKYVYFERGLHKLRNLPAETRDGYRLEIAGNIEFPYEIPAILYHGAEGVGLYRTEFLYLDRPPGQTQVATEEEQYQAYLRLVTELHPKFAVIRTMDFGGDKVGPHLGIEPEVNPVMGLRAIRFALKREDLLRQQLRAILRASIKGNLRILFPLVSGVIELRQAKAVLEDVKRELRRESALFDEAIQVGVMIEVPSAAMTVDLLAQECDFFSIGTNDLIQYMIAIDRGNERVAYLYEPFHPAILRTIKSVIASAHNQGIWVGMCGEMAGDPLCTLILVGLEIDELSMNAASIPTIKHLIRGVSLSEAAEVTYRALNLSTATEIEEYMTNELSGRFPDIFGSRLFV